MNNEIGKYIKLMTIYQAQFDKENDKSYILINEVNNVKEYHLTRTKGNVNFTDAWLEMVDDSLGMLGKYVMQQFTLLSDRKNVLDTERGNHVLISLIKVLTGESHSISTVLSILASKNRYQLFRTLDNADIILIFWGKTLGEIKKEEENLYSEYCKTGSRLFYSFYSITGVLEEVADRKICNNEVYKKYRIGNIQQLEHSFLLSNQLSEESWCDTKMLELGEKIRECKAERNKKWTSYYLAIYQIVSILRQYEQKNKFKDLFYIFFPPLRLFLSQLQEGKQLICKIDETEKKYIFVQKLEETVSDFIDGMELLIHHLGMSNSNMLNLDGRNGLSYDLSIRLCMMYLSVMNGVSRVYNDTNNEYRFMLIPIAYSRPQTSIYDFGLEPKDRLIYVRLARHQLYSPRALMAILTHEVCHYVGESRARKDRALIYSKICALILLELLLPDTGFERIISDLKVEENDREIIERDWRDRKNKLFELFSNKIVKEVDYQNKTRQSKYHFKELVDEVFIAATDIIYDRQNMLIQYSNRVSGELLERINENRDLGVLFEVLEKERKLCNDNAMKICVDEELYKMIWNVRCALRETYADLAAILFLDMKPVDYLETFLLSESYEPSEDTINNIDKNRIATVCITLRENNYLEWREEWRNINENSFGEYSYSYLLKLKSAIDDIISQYEKINQKSKQVESSENDNGSESGRKKKFDPLLDSKIIEYELEYLNTVFNNLRERIEAEKKNSDVKKDISKLYQHFMVHDTHDDGTYNQFFEVLEKVIDTYKSDVQAKWDSNSLKAEDNSEAEVEVPP